MTGGPTTGDRATGAAATGEAARRSASSFATTSTACARSWEPPPFPGAPRSLLGRADLLDYPETLSEYLPERDRRSFRASSQRLAIESIKARLAGRKGLRESVSRRYAPPAAPAPLSRPRIVDTFSYLRDLAGWLPDKAVGTAMRERLESLITRLGRTG